MTVIAYFHDLQIAFSDVMLSLETPGQHLDLPSVGKTENLDYALELSPTRLVRKYVTFDYHQKKGTFLIAGTVSHVKELLDNIKGLISGTKIIPPGFKSKVAQNGPYHLVDAACHITETSNHEDFEIIGVFGGHVFTRQYDENLRLKELPYFGRIFFSGSGAAPLYAWLAALGDQYNKRGLATDCRRVKVHRALSRIPRYLLAGDSVYQSPTIQKGVGGYYEQYSITRKGMEPVDSVLTVLAALKDTKGVKSAEVQQLLFHCYASEHLIVGALRGLPKDIIEGCEVIVDKGALDFYIIPPVFGNGREPNVGAEYVMQKMKGATNHSLSLKCRVNGRDQELGMYQMRHAIDNLLRIKVSNSIVLSLNPEALSAVLKKVNAVP